MTLQRYIAGRVVRVFLIAFIAVLLLITLVDFMELLRRSGDREGLFLTIISMAFLHAPSVSMKALPFVMLLSAMWAYMMLARSSELVAAFASGLSFWGMAKPGVLAAASIGVVGIAVYAPLSAVALNVYDRVSAKLLFTRIRRTLMAPNSAMRLSISSMRAMCSSSALIHR